MRKVATIPEIAQKAGVTTATVSRALRNSPLVKSATRERVLQIANEMKYRVNTAGRRLVTGRTQTIGLITPSLRYPLNAGIAEMLMQMLGEVNYGLLVASLNDRDAMAMSRMQMLSEHCVDGIILQPAMSSRDISCIEVIKSYRIPFVVSADVPECDVSFASYDGYDGVLKLTQHLLSQGYRRPGLITSWPSLGITPRHTQGFICALEEYGLTSYRPPIVHMEQFDEDWVLQTIEAMILGESRIDSMIVTDSSVAMHACLYLKNKNIRIGHDFGFAAADDDVWFKDKALSVTSLKYPTDTIVRTLVSMLMERIEDPQLPNQSLYFKPELVPRASSRKASS